MGLTNAEAALLADILLLHRWAGGDQTSLVKIFALQNGIESIVAELVPKGISLGTQLKIEKMLADIEAGSLLPNGLAIKGRLSWEGISESDAEAITQLCVLQSRFTDAAKKLKEDGSSSLSRWSHPVKSSDWAGAIHRFDLVTWPDKKRYFVFSPNVPRVGETIEPEKGQMMKVVHVHYLFVRSDDPLDDRHPAVKGLLIPEVHLEPIDDDEDDEDEDDEDEIHPAPSNIDTTAPIG